MYEDLYMRSWELAKALIGLLGNEWTGQKICVHCDTSLSSIITTWGAWMLGNTVVPLPVNLSPERLEFLVRDSGASLVITNKSQADKVNRITRSADLRLVVLDESWWNSPDTVEDTPLPEHFLDHAVLKDKNALLLYTAGRTGQPKGILIDHTTLLNQVNRLIELWDLSYEDTVLHTLPCSQMYGLNSLHASLSVGATVIAANSLESQKVWSHLLGVNKSAAVTVFPATPTIYKNLLATGDTLFKDKKSKEYVRMTCAKKIRLMTSSASSLPDSLNNQWSNLTGHKILNNYLCTEAGIVLSNRVGGPTNIPGPGCFACGAPVLGLYTKLVLFRDHTKTKFDVLLEDGPNGVKVEDADSDQPIIGELLIKGLTAAKKVWKEGAEVEMPNYDGWVNTGDIIKYKAGCYNVIGKLNIKTIEVEGVLVNAAELEKKVLSNPDIDDVTVVGLGDTDNVQRVAAVVVLNKNKKITLESVLNWCSTNMEEHTTPSVWKIVGDIPRDNQGHVDKFRLFELFPDIPVLCFNDSKL